MKNILSTLLIICSILFCCNALQGQDLSTHPGDESHNIILKFSHDDFNIFGVNIDEVLPFLAGDTNTFKIVFTPATGRVIYNISSMVDTIYLDYQSLMSNTNSPSIKKYFNFLNVSENNKNLTSNFFMVNILDWKIDVINFPKNKNGLSEPNNKPYGNLFFSGKFLISTF